MNAPEASGPWPARPTWVRKRDGRLEPFDADRISRSLFAAGESLGQPDPLLARELADAVLHFLAREVEGNVASTAQIAETLVKVVRELGQPLLARCWAEGQKRKGKDRPAEKEKAAAVPVGPTPADIEKWLEPAHAGPPLRRRAGAACLTQFSLERIVGRNIAAAQREGLLVLHGLDQPLELSAAVVRPLTVPLRAGVLRGAGVFEAIEQARRYVGETLAVDTPERELARCGARIGEAAAYLRELELAGRTLGLRILLNLGCETAPAWAADSFSGPLFTDRTSPESAQQVEGHLDALVEQFLHRSPDGPLALEWHIGLRDFEEEAGARRLGRLVRAALAGGNVCFAFDRPKRDVSLADGLDRGAPALLCWIGLNLVRLRERLGAVLPAVFISRCASLARLAVNAAVQRREFLRKYGWPQRPVFLFDRARLGVYLAGLSQVLPDFAETDDEKNPPGFRFIADLLAHVNAVLRDEGGQSALDCVLEDLSAEDLSFFFPAGGAGPPEASADWKARLRQAGKLHTLWGRGKVLLPLPADLPPTPDEVMELLRFAFRQTSVHRLAIGRPAASVRQLHAAWE